VLLTLPHTANFEDSLYITCASSALCARQSLILLRMPPDSPNQSSVLRNRKIILTYGFNGTTATPPSVPMTAEAAHITHATWGRLFGLSLCDLDGAQALADDVSPERLKIEITMNRVNRVIVVLSFGCWGGWSPIPDEAKYPTTHPWVGFIVFVTNGCAFNESILFCIIDQPAQLTTGWS
jgi:hypothetical protein